MDKKTILLLSLTTGLIIVAVMVILRLSQPNSSLSTPLVNKSNTPIQMVPSDTLKQYSDPAGFSFSYPDNLSLVKNDTENPNVYADIKLTAKGDSHSLNLKISDSNFPSVEEWLKANQAAASDTTKEVKLGNLKAMELKSKDRLLLGALDQGVLFTIEVPLAEKEDFWMKVYNKVLAEFTFAPPAQADTSLDSVAFEGEEVVE